MGRMIFFLLFATLGFMGYEHFYAVHDGQSPKTSAEQTADQVDQAAFQTHLNSLGPKLQSMRAGAHSYTAPSGAKYNYEITKSNKYYCPIQKKNIYRNVSVRTVN